MRMMLVPAHCCPGAHVRSDPNTRLHGLDTLRTLAILVVMMYHIKRFLPPVLKLVGSVGWMGVDLFFVLSGFLIGTQILRPVAQGRSIDVRGFYERRAYRILPAYLVVLFLYLSVPAWREQAHLPALWKFLSFTANLVMVYPAQRAFSHAWSLCIEEQFYLVLPVIVILLSRKPDVRRTILLIGTLIGAGMLIRSWELFHVIRAPGISDELAEVLTAKRIYYATYSRLDALIAGVSLALIQQFSQRKWEWLKRRANLVLVVGVMIAGCGIWLFRAADPSSDDPLGIILGFPVLALGIALLVASTTTGKGLLSKRVPGCNVVATLAFSLYLTHKEVAHLDRLWLPWLERESSWKGVAIYTLTFFAGATLLYLCVERPFLLVRDRRFSKALAPALISRIDPAL